MPQSTYLQTIARRGKSPLPVLTPPRSPLFRLDAPLMADPPDSAAASESASPISSATGFSRQPSSASSQSAMPSTPLQPSHTLLPEAGLASPQGMGVESGLMQPGSPKPPETSIYSASEAAVIPSVSPPLPPTRATHVAPAFLPIKPRSYLQTTAQISTPELSAPATETLTSRVVLRPPDRRGSSETPAKEHLPAELPSHPSPANTVHIGTIDIHIAPPPAPPLQSRAAGAKPAALAPLSRGFASPFGLRQG
jgi:hypothetical protein